MVEFHQNGAIFMKMGDFRCLGPFLAISRRPLIWTTNYCSKLVLLRCPGAQKGDFHPFSPYSTILGPKSTFCRNRLLFTFWGHPTQSPPNVPGWGALCKTSAPVRSELISREINSDRTGVIILHRVNHFRVMARKWSPCAK